MQTPVTQGETDWVIHSVALSKDENWFDDKHFPTQFPERSRGCRGGEETGATTAACLSTAPAASFLISRQETFSPPMLNEEKFVFESSNDVKKNRGIQHLKYISHGELQQLCII